MTRSERGSKRTYSKELGIVRPGEEMISGEPVGEAVLRIEEEIWLLPEEVERIAPSFRQCELHAQAVRVSDGDLALRLFYKKGGLLLRKPPILHRDILGKLRERAEESKTDLVLMLFRKLSGKE